MKIRELVREVLWGREGSLYERYIRFRVEQYETIINSVFAICVHNDVQMWCCVDALGGGVCRSDPFHLSNSEGNTIRDMKSPWDNILILFWM
jgi:hypothetical protein